MDNEKRRKLEAGIARQQREGKPLDEQFIWRIEELTQQNSLDLAENLEWFPEIEQALTLPGLELFLIGGDGRSEASLEDNGKLVLIGYLYDPTAKKVVVKFSREIFLDDHWAWHILLEVEPDYRGKGVCLRLLRQSFSLYDELGLRVVQTAASLYTGRWFWARVGFQFTDARDLRKVRKWAKKVCAALGVDLNVEEYSSTARFARMGGNRRLSIGAIAAALPDERKNYAAIAECNGLALDERIEFARAVMLTGPEWEGYLPLSGPSRVAFEVAVDSKEERLHRPVEEVIEEDDEAGENVQD